ncbi:MAG: leucyl aminopeptidase [Bacteroidota bacterium]|nr:leucyl aminopeptidase [Bacteroidota bacterium]
MIALKIADKSLENKSLCILYNELKDLKSILNTTEESNYVKKCLQYKQQVIVINQYTRVVILVQKPDEKDIPKKAEKLRKLGFEVQKVVQSFLIKEMVVENNTPSTPNIIDFLEGLVLADYQFEKYKTDKKPNSLETIWVSDLSLDKSLLKDLSNLLEGVYICRDLVNEPLSYLTAEQLSKDIEKIGKDAGFEVEVLNESKIKSLKMGGLLAVNAGSLNEPTFTVLEYKPKKSFNTQPIVFVGKGVVYDTGGYSLKPADSLDWMKCDMAGAAAVVGAMYALAKNNIPAHIIGLIPATENKLDGDAIVPGDVITMHNKKTVEVVNTDAEGRLILADALSYASKYKPLICIDLATLTGSAMRAIGKEGIVYMGTAHDSIKTDFEKCGLMTHERLVEFPLWDEYDEQLKSDIADYKNLGNGPEAGAIMGGKFLQQFANYPWLHLDIATMAYIKSPDNYRGKNATGVGVRLLYRYVKMLVGGLGEVVG